MVSAFDHCPKGPSAQLLQSLITECKVIAFDDLVKSFLGIESVIVDSHCVPPESTDGTLVRLSGAVIGAYATCLADAVVCVLSPSHEPVLRPLPLDSAHL